jgi:hypothetical protein
MLPALVMRVTSIFWLRVERCRRHKSILSSESVNSLILLEVKISLVEKRVEIYEIYFV